MEIPQLTQQDKARLMLNLPTLANRWVKFAGKQYCVLHLGIGDLEQFRAAIVPIEAVYLHFAKSELSLVSFLKIYSEEVIQMFQTAVPKAAAIVLGLPEGVVIASCCPLEAFGAVLAQWVHNQEIGVLQASYPTPPDDEPEKELPDDPSAGNPMGIVQKLASAYHWSYESILKQTVPQVYLMGNDAAWSYAKIRSDTAKTKSKPVVVDGKKQANFDGMTAEQYRKYLDSMFNRTLQVNGADIPVNIAGGV